MKFEKEKKNLSVHEWLKMKSEDKSERLDFLQILSDGEFVIGQSSLSSVFGLSR